MNLFVIVVNETRWIRFFDDHAEAYQYLNFVLPDKLKNENAYFIDNPKTYFRNGNLWFRYENSMTGDTEKHVYSIEKISQINVLNWLAEAKENRWIHQYLETAEAAQDSAGE